MCEVEVDPETGFVELIRYVAVDDVGRAVNPAIVHDQTMGAVVQGLGQALFERCVYDPDLGQLLTGSFMDYAIPRASDLPSIETSLKGIPTRNNALGVKGAGEAEEFPRLALQCGPRRARAARRCAYRHAGNSQGCGPRFRP